MIAGDGVGLTRMSPPILSLYPSAAFYAQWCLISDNTAANYVDSYETEGTSPDFNLRSG